MMVLLLLAVTMVYSVLMIYITAKVGAAPAVSVIDRLKLQKRASLEEMRKEYETSISARP